MRVCVCVCVCDGRGRAHDHVIGGFSRNSVDY